ncbi:MAG TPA: DNA polymerase III subunit gamma/tau C-terminal domain-containing protein [Burkholderiales bacterium]
MLRMLAFRPEDDVAAATPAPIRQTVQKRRPDTPAQGAARGKGPDAGPARRATVVADGAAAEGPWLDLVRQLAVTGAARELARNAEMTGRDANGFDLLVPKSKAHLAERAFMEKLTAAVEAHLGRRVALRVTIGEPKGDSVAAEDSRIKDAKKAEAVDSMQRDGFVKDLVKMFDASVVDSSVRPTRDPG